MICSSLVRGCGLLFFLLTLHADSIHIKNAQNHSLKPIPQGELDGGGIPIPLFSFPAPGESGPDRTEAFVPADPNDPVGSRCCPGDTWGFWYYNVTVPTLVPFILKGDAPGRKNAAIIIAPGGGFQFLAWHKEGTRVALWLNSIGISAFVLKYRIPGSDAGMPLIDAQRAISLVKSRANEFGFAENRIGFMGFSAGGALTSSVSCTPDRMYQPTDVADSFSHIPDYQLIIYGAGSRCQAPTVPTTFLAIAIDDQCVAADQATDYFRRIKQMGEKQHELHVFGEGRHGYGDCSAYIEGDRFQDVCSWTINAQFFLESIILKDAQINIDGSPVTYLHH